jgi:glycosyltransferase involved in cell wall biosynthesis
MALPSAAPPRVCIVSHQAFGAISGGRDGHAGGVERQTSMLATWLAQRGFSVSMLVWHEGQADVTRIDGVDVIAMCARDAGLPGARFFHPRWTSLIRAMRRADAALYYHNCAEYVTGQVALWCQIHGRRFVYSVASDLECDRRLPALKHVRERVLFRYGLRHADAIVLQTAAQRAMLSDQWSLDGTVLPMPCVGPTDDFEPLPPRPDRARAVWVGRISPEKRLDRLIAIARDSPDIDFDVVGAPDRLDGETDRLLAAASTLPNVRLRGKVPRADMPSVYTGAACLVCTSDYEGFPNTFLEAWSRGVPVVSTVDPDNVIERHGLGLVAHDTPALNRQVRRLASDPGLWRTASSSARAYFGTHHAFEPALARFEQLFREVLSRP